MDHKVYITGGAHSNKRQVSVFDLVKKQWSEAPPLNMDREHHASCIIGEKVYVIGGMLNPEFMESLRINQDRDWTSIRLPTGIQTKRIDAAVAVLNDNTVSVFGGLNVGGTHTAGYVLNLETLETPAYRYGSHDLRFSCHYS